jgi:ubiquinone/menaquinone biosynthesis C-methylase UbiE
MTKQGERKYGPKPRTKDRDTTATRFVARKAKFGDGAKKPFSAGAGAFAKKSAVTSTYRGPQKSYTPRSATGAPARPSATGYVKKMTFTARIPEAQSGVKRPYVRATTGGTYKASPRTVGHESKKVYTASTFKKSTPWARSNTPSTTFRKSGYESKFAEKKTYKPIFKSVVPNKPRTASASWGAVASWYDKHLSEADTYHEKVLLPNLLRLIEAKKGERILDLACGQGFFTRAIAKTGASVEGVDIAPELITIAQNESPTIPYHIGSADNLAMFADASQDKVLISLAIQNIENVEGVITEVARILKPNGEFHIAMNHPAFRIPKQSSWAYDDKQKVQTRRVDQYLSISRTDIDMHPGFADAPKTISHHRPLQFYFKAFTKAGFAVTKLEEWISHKTSDSGPRAKAENDARKEIPLFLYMKVVKQ